MHWSAEFETKVYDPRKEKGKNTGNDVGDLPNKRKLWNWLYLQMLYTYFFLRNFFSWLSHVNASLVWLCGSVREMSSKEINIVNRFTY